jgi:hypothetical protein
MQNEIVIPAGSIDSSAVRGKSAIMTTKKQKRARAGSRKLRAKQF